MNLSTDWVPALRAFDVEAVHWSTIGPQEASDRTIMTWARTNEAIVLTRDLDFATLLTLERRSLPSVIQLRVDQVRPERHLPVVQRVLSLHRIHLEQGAIITLQDERVRVRVLGSDAKP